MQTALLLNVTDDIRAVLDKHRYHFFDFVIVKRLILYISNCWKQNIDFRDISLQWFYNYLSNGKQLVLFNNLTSTKLETTSGVSVQMVSLRLLTFRVNLTFWMGQVFRLTKSFEPFKIIELCFDSKELFFESLKSFFPRK